MNSIRIGLIDNSFRHHPEGTTPSKTNDYIAWNRENPLEEELVCFTNEEILSPQRFSIPREKRIALLYESRDTMQWLYKNCKTIIHEYSYFFTHEKALLERFPNTYWIPGNGIWIGTKYGGETLDFPMEKDRLVSFLTSTKKTTPAQEFRVKLAKLLGSDPKYPIDVYLRSSDAHNYIPVATCLNRYMFSIVIENTVSPLYFTEKLLNCFASKTIPIYLGASETGNFFNQEGILNFKGKRDLMDVILPSISNETYLSKLHAIEENFKRSKEFSSIEQVMSRIIQKHQNTPKFT